jgi:hypothetical protein
MGVPRPSCWESGLCTHTAVGRDGTPQSIDGWTDAALITIADRAESFFILLEGTNATSNCELERKRFSKSAGHE